MCRLQYEAYLKEVEAQEKPPADNVFFVKQSIRNSCGAIALLHSVANNRDK